MQRVAIRRGVRSRRGALHGRPLLQPVPLPHVREALTADSVMHLQQSVGNAAVTRLIVSRDPETKKSWPKMRPRFGFVSGTLNQKEWAEKKRLEQYADVAHLAGADAIPSVSGLDAASINEITELKKGQPVKPGLNYFAAYGDGEATAGFVDDSGNWAGDILPAAKSGALPKVAIVLGAKAFKRDEAYALGSVRHEMEHARHFELSIEWLAKWRDSGSKKTFSVWLAEQSGHIPPEVLPLIRLEHDSSRHDTEFLAYLEGFVATFQFLPSSPDIGVMKAGNYPHALAQLKQLGLPQYSGWASKVRASGLDRIQELCCKGLNEDGRKKMIAWLSALLDPSLFGSPANDDEKSLHKLIRNDFGTGWAPDDQKSARAELKKLIEDMLEVAKKSCK